MTSASRGQLAVAGCCLVAALGYSGAVRVPALLTFVLPSLVVVGLVAMQLPKWVGTPVAAALSSLLALALAQVANVTAGETSGPVARSTFLAGLFTAVAVAAAAQASPALVCLPVALVLVGALYLGAAGEVLPVLVATMVVLVLTVPLLEGSRRKADGAARGRWLPPLLALAVGGSALAVAQFQVDSVHKAPAVLAQAQIDRSITPPLSRVRARQPTRTATDSRPPTTQRPSTTAAPTHPASRGPGRILPVIGLLLGAFVALVLIRLALVAVAWQRLRRRLRSGTPERSVRGAWLWAVLRLRSYGVPIAISVSPDTVAAGASLLPLSDAVSIPLRETANWAEQATFQAQPALTTETSSQVWAAGIEATTTRRGELGTGRRLLTALRMPPALPREHSGGNVRPRAEAHWTRSRFRRPRPV